MTNRMPASEWASLLRGDAAIAADALAELDALLVQARSRNSDGLSKAEGAESLRRRLDVDDTLSLAAVKVKRMRGAQQ